MEVGFMANNKDEYLSKFQELLKTLFQFEASDLDFGIYRILNYKRDLVEKFINEDLVDKVETAFSKYKERISARIKDEFEQKKQEIIKTLGKDALTLTGDIAEQYKDSPIAKEYLKLKEDKEEFENINDIKSQVYNDLYSFFSRYYEDGDFAPHYRYSIKSHKYAIPYNGEEVKLYWANYDQYYVKTGELFRDYTFGMLEGNYKGIFRVVEAREELGSNKATKERFFVLDDEAPVQVDDKKIIIRFQYRELTEVEVRKYDVGGGNNTSKQEKINEKLYKDIIASIEDSIFKNTLQSNYKNDKQLLLYQLNRFTRKNTSDYFIHKNLKKFLTEQLDYFIKSDVLSIDTLEEEKNNDKHITRAKVVKEIGEDIIDFLSQIEDFQKRLWEKKKFVIRTEYVITTDRVPEEFYSEIYSNSEQRKEWEELGFDIPDKKEKLKESKLPVDTKHFSSDFKYRLLEKLSEKRDIDDLLDGLLIKSENYQALKLIMDKYKGRVQTIYIDPPYNTGNDGFLYQDKFRHSSWLSMIYDRLERAQELMNSKGVIFTSIGDLNPQEGESYRLQVVESEVFPKRFGNLIWKKRGGIGSFSEKDLTENHEYVTVYGNKDSFIWNNIISDQKIKQYSEKDDKGPFRWMDLVGPSQQTKEKRPNLNYGVIYDVTNDKIVGFEYFEKDNRKKDFFDDIFSQDIVSIWLDGDATWLIGRKFMEDYYKKGLIKVFRTKDKFAVKIKNYLYKEGGTLNGDILKSILSDNGVGVGMNVEATKTLLNLFPGLDVSKVNPKPVSLVKLLIYVTCIENEVILDFFAGSGTTAHAVMKLNKEDGGKRKFIIVEMADYFDTIIIPRIKKVAYSFNWQDGKPQDKDGAGGFFKYQVLEQYEDSLDNIELKENLEAQKLFKDEYLLKYFLDFETRESPYLLNLDMLKNPFEYKLKVNLSEVGEPKETVVDIPETFAYLLGLKVKKIKAREDSDRKYLFMLGEKDSQNCAVVFREYDDKWEENDFAKDKEFMKQELKDWQPSIVYVNGQCTLTSDFNGTQIDVRSIEDSFKSLMEATYYGNR
jgi:adenine-specific DNA-methyltransferase